MRIAVVLVAVGLLMAADSDSVKKEMALLEGEWAMVSGEIDRQPLPEQFLKGARRVARDGETTVTINGQLFMKARFKVDPDKKPRTIDYTMTGGPSTGKTQLGIYDLDGDTVKFCFASPGQARPSEFATRDGSGLTLSVWKRVKKK